MLSLKELLKNFVSKPAKIVVNFIYLKKKKIAFFEKLKNKFLITISFQALIHVSTAYCNCDKKDVEEVIYPAPQDPEQIIQCTSWMDDQLVEELTPKLIAGRPNTYTFTKALAESMLLQESGNLPVAIVRPSIVLSSFREPIAGWVDNWNGPTGIIAAAGKGFFRYLCSLNMYKHCKKDCQHVIM